MTSAANTGALARLLELAAPHPWALEDRYGVVMAEDGRPVAAGVYHRPDARLIALAPDAIRLLTDMADQLALENEKHPNHNITKLLARFAALEERAAQ